MLKKKLDISFADYKVCIHKEIIFNKYEHLLYEYKNK
ncbi:type II toxin-antitoxin system SpoIISB family antitoxin [Bacillus sp. PsM16]